MPSTHFNSIINHFGETKDNGEWLKNGGDKSWIDETRLYYKQPVIVAHSCFSSISLLLYIPLIVSIFWRFFVCYFFGKKNDFWLRDIVKETTQSNVHFMSVWCNLGWLSFGPRNFHYINSGKNLFAYHRSIETRRWWHIVFWWQTKMARSHRNTQQAKPATKCALTSSSNARIRK